jgi:hypothetical protein
MYCYFTITRYPPGKVMPALRSMGYFRPHLQKQAGIDFYKLMGSGKNGSFDIHPDWQQWALIHFTKEKPETITETNIRKIHRHLYGPYIDDWWERYECERWTALLEPAEGHGSWDGYVPDLSGVSALKPDEPVAVLTRATIRLSKLPDFWKRVGPVSARMKDAPGLQFSAGVGEAPFYRQATFSFWKDLSSMKDFAYKMQEHRDVVRDTRKFNWYREEMFLRFRLLKSIGTLRGIEPLSKS